MDVGVIDVEFFAEDTNRLMTRWVYNGTKNAPRQCYLSTTPPRQLQIHLHQRHYHESLSVCNARHLGVLRGGQCRLLCPEQRRGNSSKLRWRGWMVRPISTDTVLTTDTTRSTPVPADVSIAVIGLDDFESCDALGNLSGFSDPDGWVRHLIVYYSVIH